MKGRGQRKKHKVESGKTTRPFSFQKYEGESGKSD